MLRMQGLTSPWRRLSRHAQPDPNYQPLSPEIRAKLADAGRDPQKEQGNG